MNMHVDWLKLLIFLLSHASIGFSFQFRQGKLSSRLNVAANLNNNEIQGLFFDCDGVLAETERDVHRITFNQAFESKGVNAVWDVELYGELLKIGGGKERMTHYFN
jgi:hypothetical protein